MWPKVRWSAGLGPDACVLKYRSFDNPTGSLSLPKNFLETFNGFGGKESFAGSDRHTGGHMLNDDKPSFNLQGVRHCLLHEGFF